jgi:hypothetical protein
MLILTLPVMIVGLVIYGCGPGGKAVDAVLVDVPLLLAPILVRSPWSRELLAMAQPARWPEFG